MYQQLKDTLITNYKLILAGLLFLFAGYLLYKKIRGMSEYIAKLESQQTCYDPVVESQPVVSQPKPKLVPKPVPQLVVPKPQPVPQPVPELVSQPTEIDYDEIDRELEQELLNSEDESKIELENESEDEEI